MQLSTTDLIRLFQFLERIETEAYPETPAPIHTLLTERAFNKLHELYPVNGNIKVLDVGCGQGPALRLFRNAGASTIGITLNQTDVDVCRAQGFDVRKMDQSFLNFEPNSFDIVWARHVIEHSIMPFFTLSEFYRVLKPGGMLYLEIPGADTASNHAWNPNHYSVLSSGSWLALLTKSGFECLDTNGYSLTLTESGDDDVYWGFYCRR